MSDEPEVAEFGKESHLAHALRAALGWEKMRIWRRCIDDGSTGASLTYDTLFAHLKGRPLQSAGQIFTTGEGRAAALKTPPQGDTANGESVGYNESDRAAVRLEQPVEAPANDDMPTEAMCDEARGFILGLDLGCRTFGAMQEHLDMGGYSNIPYIILKAIETPKSHITKWEVAECIWLLMERARPVPATERESAQSVDCREAFEWWAVRASYSIDGGSGRYPGQMYEDGKTQCALAAFKGGWNARPMRESGEHEYATAEEILTVIREALSCGIQSYRRGDFIVNPFATGTVRAKALQVTNIYNALRKWLRVGVAP